MRKKFLGFIAAPLVLVGCGSAESAEESSAVVTVTETQAPEYSQAEIETAVITKCFDVIADAVDSSGNEAGSLRWASSPVVDLYNDPVTYAELDGEAFINTSAGIPWKHQITCTAAVRGGEATIVDADAVVPSLQ